MSARLVSRMVVAAALVAAARPAALRAQADLADRGAALAARVSNVPNGTVRFTFPLRPGICGIGESVRVGRDERWVGNGWYGDMSGNGFRGRDVEWERACETGPGRVVLDMSAGVVQQTRFYVGGRWRPPVDEARVVDLGDVPADQAAGLLLRIAQGQGVRADERAMRSAIFPATLGADVTPWPALLRLARDPMRSRELRQQATHWLGVSAGEAATAGLADLADDPDREVRVQALYALSRRPAAEGVPALIKIARTHRDPAMRRQAMFWLGRSDDARAVALFEELLLAKR